MNLACAESGAKSMSTFCAAGGVWNVFINSHTTVLAAQNASFQMRRSGLSPDCKDLIFFDLLWNEHGQTLSKCWWAVLSGG